MKKWFIPVLAAMILFSLAACGESKPDYRTAGLEVTKLLGQMAADEHFISMLAGSEAVETIRETVNTGDYDRPVAVYELKMTDPKVYVESNLDEKSRETWDKIPEELKEQTLMRIGVPVLCTMHTSRQSAAEIAFSSLATAIVRNEELTAEDTVYYLYIFEKGTPILVSFGYHGASGSFVFLPKEQCGTLADLQAALPELEITPVEN